MQTPHYFVASTQSRLRCGHLVQVCLYMSSSSQFINTCWRQIVLVTRLLYIAVLQVYCFACSFISMSVILQAAIPSSGPPSYSRRQTSHRVSLPPGSPITQRSLSPSSPPGENTVSNLNEQRRRSSSGANRKRRALTLDMSTTGKRVFVSGACVAACRQASYFLFVFIDTSWACIF